MTSLENYFLLTPSIDKQDYPSNHSMKSIIHFAKWSNVMVVVVIKNSKQSIHSIPVRENFSLTSTSYSSWDVRLLIDGLFRKLVNANQAPKKGEQISHRFQEFLDNKEQAAQANKNKKNKNKFKQEESERPELEQKTSESDRQYLQRLDQVNRR